MNTNEWEEALRRDAARLKNETPEGLDRRITLAVASFRAAAEGSRRCSSVPAVIVLAAAAACAPRIRRSMPTSPAGEARRCCPLRLKSPWRPSGSGGRPRKPWHGR